MKIIKYFASLGLAILITSCVIQYNPYTPKVTLEASNGTINKRVQIEKFIDSSPIKDKSTPFGGVSLTSNKPTPLNLESEVANAVVLDFSVNGLFQQASRKMDNPDFVMKGEILKFMCRSESSDYAKVAWLAGVSSIAAALIVKEPLILLGATPCLIAYSGIRTGNTTIEIELVVNLFDKKNSLIGTYKGRSNYKKTNSMYNYPGSLGLNKLTNQCFSDAVHQIREQIVRDKVKLEKEN